MTSVVISSLLTLHLKHSVWLSPVMGDLSPPVYTHPHPLHPGHSKWSLVSLQARQALHSQTIITWSKMSLFFNQID